MTNKQLKLASLHVCYVGAMVLTGLLFSPWAIPFVIIGFLLGHTTCLALFDVRVEAKELRVSWARALIFSAAKECEHCNSQENFCPNHRLLLDKVNDDHV